MRRVPATLLTVALVIAAAVSAAPVGAAAPAPAAPTTPEVVPTTDDPTPASLPPGASTGDIRDGPLPEDPSREAADAVVRDGATYFAGQLLFGSGAAPGEELLLRRVTQLDDAGDPTETELVDTVVADDGGEFYLRTADRDPGQYVLRGTDGSGRLATFEVVAQRFDEVSAEAANGTAALTVASNRASYDLVLTATRDGRSVQPTDLADAVASPDARPVDTNAEDGLDAVLIGGSDGGDATVRIDASALPDGEYAITASAPDATGSATETIAIDDGTVRVPGDGDDSEDGGSVDPGDEFDRVWDAPLPADPTREAADAALRDGGSYVLGQVLFDGNVSPGEDVQVRKITAVDDAGDPTGTRLVDTTVADDDGEYLLETGWYDAGEYLLVGSRSDRIARIDLTRQSFTAFAVREPAGEPNGTALLDVASNRSSFEVYLTADRNGENVPVGTLEEVILAPDARAVDWALDRTTELDVVALEVTGGEATVRLNASALPDGEYVVRGGVPDATATGTASVTIEDGVARVPEERDGRDRDRDRDRNTDQGDERSDEPQPPERVPVALEADGSYERGMVLQSTDATAAAADEALQVRAVVGRSPLQTVLQDAVAADATGSYAVDTAFFEPGEYIVRGDESGLIARFTVTAPSESADRSTVMGVRDPDGDATVEDVNGDGHLTILDVSALLTMVDDDPAGVARLDVDGDGSLSIRDVALLLQEVVETN
jgi:hypothetical protein